MILRLLPIVVAVLVWLPALRGGFVWDDNVFLESWIATSTDLRSILFPDPSLTHGVPYYRPAVFAAFFLEWLAFGKNPAGWHAVSVAVHAIAVAGVHVLLRRVVPRESDAAAGACAFAAWPALAETIGWVNGQTDLFAGAFVAWALVLHLRARDRGRSSLAAGAVFLLGLLSKETAVAFLPIAIAATVLLPPPPGAPAKARSPALFLPHLLALAISEGLRRVALGAGGSMAGAGLERLRLEAIGTMLRAGGWYVRQTLLLGAGDPFVEYVPGDALTIACAILAIAATAAAVALRRRAAILGAVVFASGIAPAIAVAASPLSVNALAMRYLYVPGIAVAIFGALLASAVPGRILRFAPALAIPLALLANARLAPWRSNDALWQRAWRDDPDSLTVHVGLSGAALQRGDRKAAEDHLRIAAWTARPRHEAQKNSALVKLARWYAMSGRFAEARVAIAESAKHGASESGLARAMRVAALYEILSAPRDPAGRLLVRREELERQALALEQAAALDSLDATSRMALAAVYDALDEPVHARRMWLEIARLRAAEPSLQEAALRNAEVLAARVAAEADPVRRLVFEAQQAEIDGDLARAISAWERALALAPDRADLLDPLASLEARRGNAARAALLVERAVSLRPGDPSLWLNLGLHRMETREWRAAADAFRRATELAPDWPKAWVNHARALDLAGDVPGAIAAYEAFLLRYGAGNKQARAVVEQRVRELRSGNAKPLD